MGYIFDGKTESKNILDKVRKSLETSGNKSSLGIIHAGTSAKQAVFTKLKKDIAESLGIHCEIFSEKESAITEELTTKIADIASKFDGVLVQLPLPAQIDRYAILNSIPYEKDVEGLCSRRMGEVCQTETKIYSPVAKAVCWTLEKAVQQVKLPKTSNHCVIIGNSYLVGRPLGQVLSRAGYTVTICDTEAENLNKYTQNADILVSCTGIKNLIKPDMVKDGVIAIDVGFDLDKTNRIFADMDPNIAEKSAFFSPVPGGIGPLTIAFIFENLIALKS